MSYRKLLLFKKNNALSVARGFTLLELMMVLLIISILVVIALPVYQDYTIRTKVSEGVAGVSPLKTVVVEYHASNNAYPPNSEAVGLNPLLYKTQYVQKIEIIGDEIIVTSDAPSIEGDTIIFKAIFNGSYKWFCTGGTMEDKYRPTDCRS